MRGPKISFTVKKRKRLKNKIAKTIAALQDRSDAHEAIGEYFNLRWMRNYINQGGGDFYGVWPTLSSKTLRDRMIMGVNTDHMLIRSGGDYSKVGRPGDYPGRLFDSLSESFEEVEVTPDATKWSFNNRPPRYLLSHHFGQSGLPARPLFGVNAYDETSSLNIMDEHVYDVLRQIW